VVAGCGDTLRYEKKEGKERKKTQGGGSFGVTGQETS